MARLIYVTNMSLDGYIEDQHGAYDMGPPDDDLFASYTDLVRSVGTFLYGRRLYETMAVWETDAALAAQSHLMADFATAWQAPSKVVYSTTLETADTPRTRIERDFDADAVRRLKESATSDLAVGGAELAAHAFRAITTCSARTVPRVVRTWTPSGRASMDSTEVCSQRTRPRSTRRSARPRTSLAGFARAATVSS